jgi:hypothetical protein
VPFADGEDCDDDDAAAAAAASVDSEDGDEEDEDGGICWFPLGGASGFGGCKGKCRENALRCWVDLLVQFMLKRGLALKR